MTFIDCPDHQPRAHGMPCATCGGAGAVAAAEPHGVVIPADDGAWDRAYDRWVDARFEAD